MKKLTAIILFVLWIVQPAFSQNITSTSSKNTNRVCATKAPGQQWENWMQQKIAQRNLLPLNQRNTVYTLPVIMHIIHDGEAIGTQSNISDAQAISQIDVLNEDFRRLNADNTNLPSVWTSIAADCEINFIPAVVDTSGITLSVAGINRINRNTAGFTTPPYTTTYFDNTIKPATIWDPNDYLNIWVADLSNNVLGYATFPPSSTLTGIPSGSEGTLSDDGIVLLYSATGRVGTLLAAFNKGRTGTHEVGHWLGLRHIWGDATCGTDYCADTPLQRTNNLGCPTFPSTSNCGGPNGPDGDMFFNFMDYSDDACLITFTEDQKTRVQTAMANSPFRINLANSTTGQAGNNNVAVADSTFDDWVTTGAVTSTNTSVGIGTGSVATGYLLSVDGKIIAEEMQVLDSGTWPDYVFNKDYDLMSLEELEQFIKVNQHLPGIPSAQIVKEEGIGVGEMNKLLLEKIEELTLHIIEQAKQMNAQSKQLDNQVVQMAVQAQQIKRLQQENLELQKKMK